MIASESVLRDKILRCCAFAPLPAAAMRILRLGERRTVGVDELSEMLGADGALGAAVLRAINSSSYVPDAKVTSIRQAVALLGVPSVQTLVLGVTIAAAVPVDPKASDLAAYWRRCVYSAAAARALAARFLPGSVEDCFVAALLMDLGALVLDRALGDRYRRLSHRVASHAQLVKQEIEAFGVGHPETAAMLIRHWGLPPALEIPIGAHHCPQLAEDSRHRAMADILELSSRCAEVYLNVDPAEAIIYAREALAARHEAALAEADKLLARIGQKAAELAPLLSVNLEPREYAAVLEKATPRLLELALGRRQATIANKRRAPRQARQGALALFPCAHGALGREVRVGLRDLSANGIGIIHNRAIAPASQFIVLLPQGNGPAKSLLYTAVRCDPSGDDFHIGAELRAVLNTAQPPGLACPAVAQK